MIISKNTHPDKDLYVIGAHIINALKKIEGHSVDFFRLHEKVSDEHEVSIQLFSLSVSWLYLLGVIDNDNSGNIQKCF
ncbi:hypothetical protein FKN08_02100 [Vibrio sp. 1-2 (7-a)]|uniref:ABC-three component system middle component 6 n=1 Tax=Vibrio TaxID=662 RepID=UPI0014822A48|nr:ABC-three component system middle component 6 [Vibrio sp. 1-2 (7-a)]NNN54993.1 hypothetical protein [Vibrio sp. 1-2 (7-a)]